MCPHHYGIIGSGPVKDFFSWFSRSQRRRPLSVAVGTSLSTYFLGDVLAQEISGEQYDWTRTARMLVIGGYKWFLFLGSHFNYGSAIASITLKVFIQQMFFAPIFNTYFFGVQAALSGQSMTGLVERVRTAVPESIVSSAKFWPAVTALNFTLIPAHLRFAFSAVFAVVWQTYLSFLNRKKEESHMAEVEVGFSGLAEEARDRAGERLEEAGIADLVEDATEKITEAVEDAKKKVTEVVEDAKGKVSEVLSIKDDGDKKGDDKATRTRSPRKVRTRMKKKRSLEFSKMKSLALRTLYRAFSPQYIPPHSLPHGAFLRESTNPSSSPPAWTSVCLSLSTSILLSLSASKAFEEAILVSLSFVVRLAKITAASTSICQLSDCDSDMCSDDLEVALRQCKTAPYPYLASIEDEASVFNHFLFDGRSISASTGAYQITLRSGDMHVFWPELQPPV